MSSVSCRGLFCLSNYCTFSRYFGRRDQRKSSTPFYNCFLSAETETETFPAALVFLAWAISPRALRPVRTLVAAIAAK